MKTEYCRTKKERDRGLSPSLHVAHAAAWYKYVSANTDVLNRLESFVNGLLVQAPHSQKRPEMDDCGVRKCHPHLKQTLNPSKANILY